IAVFTLAVKLPTSFLYLASSFSSRVTLALTMAMLSFMRGTWSFMSRMFCCRISSGSSATEMKKPTNDRPTLDNRCHINPPVQERCAVFDGGGGAFTSPVVIGFSLVKYPTASAIFFSSCCFFKRQPVKRSFSRDIASLLLWIFALCSVTYLSIWD